jgi:hypothetical protein
VTSGGTTWDNGLPCGATSGTFTVAAPANGSVNVTFALTTAGTTQSGSIAVAVSDIYPNGHPATTISETTTIGSPLSAPPSPCAVTTPVPGPIVPITAVSTSWSPTNASTDTYQEVDYLAPGIGIVCSLYSFNDNTVALTGQVFYQNFPLQYPSYIFNFNGSEADSLTGVGPATQPGTVVATGAKRMLGRDVTQIPMASILSRVRALNGSRR